jgi:hypothetical protein
MDFLQLMKTAVLDAAVWRPEIEARCGGRSLSSLAVEPSG